MKTELQLGEYQHYKGGVYEMVGIAQHSETLEKMAVYKHLDTGELWVRPLDMFTETVEVNGERVPRFKKIGGE